MVWDRHCLQFLAAILLHIEVFDKHLYPLLPPLPLCMARNSPGRFLTRALQYILYLCISIWCQRRVHLFKQKEGEKKEEEQFLWIDHVPGVCGASDSLSSLMK